MKLKQLFFSEFWLLFAIKCDFQPPPPFHQSRVGAPTPPYLDSRNMSLIWILVRDIEKYLFFLKIFFVTFSFPDDTFEYPFQHHGVCHRMAVSSIQSHWYVKYAFNFEINQRQSKAYLNREACICNVFNLFIILSNGAELRQIRNIYYQLSQTCFEVTWMDLKSKGTKPRMEHQKGFFCSKKQWLIGVLLILCSLLPGFVLDPLIRMVVIWYRIWH